MQNHLYEKSLSLSLTVRLIKVWKCVAEIKNFAIAKQIKRTILLSLFLCLVRVLLEIAYFSNILHLLVFVFECCRCSTFLFYCCVFKFISNTVPSEHIQIYRLCFLCINISIYFECFFFFCFCPFLFLFCLILYSFHFCCVVV